jgi:hypothetical protein
MTNANEGPAERAIDDLEVLEEDLTNAGAKRCTSDHHVVLFNPTILIDLYISMPESQVLASKLILNLRKLSI